MRTLLVVVGVAGIFIVGVGAALIFRGSGSGDTTVEVIRTDLGETVEGLPREVWLTRSRLSLAAESGDYEAIRELIPTEGGFEYTFGGAAPGGPIAYWQQLEQETPDRPLATLAAIMKLPYTLSRGYYVWPFAYDVADVVDLSPHERELLAPLGSLERLFFPDTGYLGWRAGIAPDGTWAFYVAGD